MTMQPPPPLSDDEVHLWLADYARLDTPELVGRYLALLSAEERIQQQRFHFERDRQRYLVTRAMLRSLLGAYCSLPECALRFDTNPFGKPALCRTIAGDLAPSFNVSHTHSLIAIAIARGRCLGVDVEHAERPAALDIAARFFCASEHRQLLARPEPERAQRFYELWTLKEAYIKGRGMGMSLPLDGFAFDLGAPGRIGFATGQAVQDRASAWHFWQYRLAGNYLLALCAASRNAAAPRVQLHTLIPLVGWQSISTTPSRRSPWPPHDERGASDAAPM